MKKIQITIILLMIIFNLYAQQDVFEIKKGQIASIDCIGMTPETYLYYVKQQTENKQNIEKISLFNDKIINLESLIKEKDLTVELLELRLSVHTQLVDIYKQKYDDYDKIFVKNKMLTVGLNIGISVGIVGCFVGIYSIINMYNK